MKQTLTLLALILMMFGCKKNDDNTLSSALTPTPTSTWSFTANVDGVLSTADSARGYLHIDTSLGIPLRVFILKGHCPGKYIIPAFGDIINSTTLTTLNYNNVAAGAQLQYHPLNDTVNDFQFTEASFNITSVDTSNKKISGNFSGIVVGNVTGDTVVITNGTFTNIIYQVW